MSLINEALKRARDASCQTPPPSPVSPSYQPVMTPPMMSSPSTTRHATWLILAGIVIAAATLMLWNRKYPASVEVVAADSNPRTTQPATPVPVTINSPAPTPVVASIPVTEPVPIADAPMPSQDVKPLNVEPVHNNEPATEVFVTQAPAAMPVATALPPPPPPPPPALKLQAVMMHGALRQAIINGQTAQAGDTVDGAEVVRIEQRTVILRWHNTDITLRMP